MSEPIEMSEHIELSAKSAKFLGDLLNSPPPASDALKSAFKRYRDRKVPCTGQGSDAVFDMTKP